MKIHQLRPKFPLEQYVIAFEFPGTPSGIPAVSVELVTGEDANYESFAGWLFTTGNVVCVLLVGGVPGCIYKIACTCTVGGDDYTREGVVAVKPTEAIAPPGFGNPSQPELPPAAIPFTKKVSSHIYPIFTPESGVAALAPTGGLMVRLLYEAIMQSDEVVAGAFPSGGMLFEVPPPEFLDEVITGLSPIGGELKIPPPQQFFDENLPVLAPVGGKLAPPPLGEMQEDEAVAGLAPIGGSLTTSISATWNPLDSSALMLFTNGNKTVTMSGASGVQYRSFRGTQSYSSGKYYYEVNAAYTRTNGTFVGIATSSMNLDNYVGADTAGWGYAQVDGSKAHGGGFTSFGSPYSDGDIIGVAVDIDNGKVWFSKNGVWQGGGDPSAGTGEAFTGVSGSIFPAATLLRSNETLTGKFKVADFTYTPPTGFSPWGTV